MICGIDLGTTNSLIGYGDELFTGTVSSSVDINNKCHVERDVHGDGITSSYKVDMCIGTNPSSVIARKCSSIILKELVGMAEEKTGETIKDIVISVPAMFTPAQRQAVCDSAVEAGLNPVALINEPTAAAIYTCSDIKDFVIVYDLGGGTFDVTILDSRVGKFIVHACDGNTRLAGDNFDNAIIEDIFSKVKIDIRYKTDRNISMLRKEVRLAKEAIQHTFGEPQTISLSMFNSSNVYTLTEDVYISIMQEVFEPTLTMTKDILERYVTPIDNPTLIFVGGSTACPYLRDWIASETGLEVRDCYDEDGNLVPPDLIVAKGVALYAKMFEEGTSEEDVIDVTNCLCIEDSHGLAQVIIHEGTNIPTSGTRIFTNSCDTQVVEVKLYQGNDALICNNIYIGSLLFDYGEVVEAGEGEITVTLTVNRNGILELVVMDNYTLRTERKELIMK